MPITAKQKVKNYCPFGCVSTQLDENGHCVHLIGFTNDGKTYEPNRPMIHPRTGVANGLRQTSGNNPNDPDPAKRVNLRKIRSTDMLVNPEFQQLDNGAYHTAKEWVSSRVYRESVKLFQPGLPGSDYLDDDDEPVQGPVPSLDPVEASGDAPPAWAAGLMATVAKLNERLDAIESVVTTPAPEPKATTEEETLLPSV